jgi:hypothetical protein
MKAADAKPRSWRDRSGIAAERNGKDPPGVGMAPSRDEQRHAASPHLSVIPNAGSAKLRVPLAEQPAQARKLSIRAENVLKILAAELTGETPPRGKWVPSDLLLRRLTYRHLSTARNCGPRTTAEIIKWAQTRGTTIRRSFYAGKSLSAMWQDIVAKCSTGEISKAEVAEALENSTRRRNTRIPVALQRMLLQLIRSSNE